MPGGDAGNGGGGGGVNARMDWPEFVTHLCRNFGGKPDVLAEVLRVFHAECESRQQGRFSVAHLPAGANSDAGGSAAGGGAAAAGLSPSGGRRVATELPSSLDLVRANLCDQNARHLMVLTARGAALALLFQCGVVSHTTTTVLIGSSFAADSTEYLLISQINAVKRAMQVGQTVLLYNCDNLYEALYGACLHCSHLRSF
jgi:hypothetical protein